MFSGSLQTLVWVAAAVLLLNVPFGYWRDSTRRFSLQWILAIHLPIPMVIGLRIASHLGWQWSTFPVMIGSYLFGQFIGGRLHRWRKRRG